MIYKNEFVKLNNIYNSNELIEKKKLFFSFYFYIFAIDYSLN